MPREHTQLAQVMQLDWVCLASKQVLPSGGRCLFHSAWGGELGQGPWDS